ncbi:DUF4402 domain-containing protein [Massilia sp. GCM10020059]|uniref:DUF4402 domain-containing protein n=1 Tax=Massilia agrisoli TaxID=2892444 RepID=A0ABS8IUZ6_9BURK|nr:DUF4402 domain-containing protein [Massilia agrisoli]MCC6072270.1 DUF4402 domain-containing protein [Massilia agrisoli]
MFALVVFLLPLAAMAQILPPLEQIGTVPEQPAGGPAAQLSLVNTRSLSFGPFVAGSGGTLTVAPNGARSRSGGVVLISSAGAGSAGFNLLTLNGSGASKSVIVSLPGNGEVFLANGPYSMPVVNFVSGSGSLLTLTPSGLAFDVGATLSVGPNQPAGDYSASFQVTVNYQ